VLENKRLVLVRNTCCWINSEQSFDLYYDNIELRYVFVMEDKDEYAYHVHSVCLFHYYSYSYSYKVSLFSKLFSEESCSVVGLSEQMSFQLGLEHCCIITFSANSCILFYLLYC